MQMEVKHEVKGMIPTEEPNMLAPRGNIPGGDPGILSLHQEGCDSLLAFYASFPNL